jgi:hypothetical protein
MEKDYLLLRRASVSRPSGEWNDDDFDVLADGVVVGRIMKANAAPADAPWLWTLEPFEHSPGVRREMRFQLVRHALPFLGVSRRFFFLRDIGPDFRKIRVEL